MIFRIILIAKNLISFDGTKKIISKLELPKLQN